MKQFTSCNQDFFVEVEGDIVAGNWFKSKFRTENKFFHFVQVGHVLSDGSFVCYSSGQIHPKDDVICKVDVDYERWFLERVSRLTAKLQEMGKVCQPGFPADTPGNQRAIKNMQEILKRYTQ